MEGTRQDMQSKEADEKVGILTGQKVRKREKKERKKQWCLTAGVECGRRDFSLQQSHEAVSQRMAAQHTETHNPGSVYYLLWHTCNINARSSPAVHLKLQNPLHWGKILYVQRKTEAWHRFSYRCFFFFSTFYQSHMPWNELLFKITVTNALWHTCFVLANAGFFWMNL